MLWTIFFNHKLTLLINQLARKSIINTSIVSVILAVSTKQCSPVAARASIVHGVNVLPSATVLACPTCGLLLLRNAGHFKGISVELDCRADYWENYTKWCVCNLYFHFGARLWWNDNVFTSSHGHFIFSYLLFHRLGSYGPQGMCRIGLSMQSSLVKHLRHGTTYDRISIVCFFFRGLLDVIKTFLVMTISFGFTHYCAEESSLLWWTIRSTRNTQCNLFNVSWSLVMFGQRRINIQCNL